MSRDGNIESVCEPVETFSAWVASSEDFGKPFTSFEGAGMMLSSAAEAGLTFGPRGLFRRPIANSFSSTKIALCSSPA